MPPKKRDGTKGRQTMFNSDFQRIATAVLGALASTAVSVGAAVGPARLAETAPVALAAAPVAGQANV
jgi:uncharacterized membrane protein